jgi:hypothetical protein
VLGAEPRTPGRQGHTIRDDERRVEPHPELPDQGVVLGAVAGQRLEELAGPRARDGADGLGDLLATHADTVVGHRHGAPLLVHADADPQVRVAFVERIVGQRLEAQLFRRVRGVRDELAEKDLLVAVQGADHQAEDLAHLRLEAERFLV